MNATSGAGASHGPPGERYDADVVVVGGGPVGLATAITLTQAGMAAIVLEPRTGPIDKACGEGLMPSAVRRLAALGVRLEAPADGLPFEGIRYVQAGAHGPTSNDAGRQTSVSARFRDGPGLGVRRTTLHTALNRRAEQLGIRVVEGRVDAIDQSSDGVRVTGAGVEGVGARYLVGADGLHSTVRRLVGIPTTSPGRPRFGQRRHYRVAPWTTMVEVHWAEHSEAYLTPVAPDLLGVAILTSSKGSYDEQLASFPALQERLRHADHEETLGAGPLRQSVSRRTSGRVALVGDAAGYVDALTGEGLNVGLASAEALARCLVDDTLDDYEARWRAASRRYRVMTSSLVWARNQRALGRRIVPAAALMPPVFSIAVQQLA